MQWPVPCFTAAEQQKLPPCPMTFGSMDGALDGSVDAMAVTTQQAAALKSLMPMDRSQLYDLAEMLLSEMIPGWDEDDDDGDLDWEEDEDEVADEEMVAVRDPILDASYRACILETERYLVQCEGLDGGVVADLKDYLNEARLQAVSGTAPQERQRPPGYP